MIRYLADGFQWERTMIDRRTMLTAIAAGAALDDEGLTEVDAHAVVNYPLLAMTETFRPIVSPSLSRRRVG